MISVENFYWVLYQNLLVPSGMTCQYYYPYGTKDNLSNYEFKLWERKSDIHHVFFHFDQEPLWSNQLGLYDSHVSSWTNKFVKILANSEQSDLKKQLCKERGFLDWYYFYHGFAALDWYRDAKYISKNHGITNAFLSFNHEFKHRSYRLALLARLLDYDVTARGSISFHAAFKDIVEELGNPDTALSAHSMKLIEKHIDKIATLPWKLDDVPISGSLSARFGHKEYELWQRSLFHLVNETVFYEPKLHLTEKVFKPIVAQRPFILVASPGNLEYLRSYGFKSFDRWIDESYDKVQDPDRRLDMIAGEIARLSQMSIEQLQEIHQDMLPILEYNKLHFFDKFRDNIVTELIENFDRCIRIWNNGRVDSRELQPIQDFESSKAVLLL